MYCKIISVSRELTENTLATEVGVSCSRAISTVWAPSREIRTVSWIANLEAIVTRGQESIDLAPVGFGGTLATFRTCMSGEHY